MQVLIQLRSQDSEIVFAETVFQGLSSSWQNFSTHLLSNGTDFKGELAVTLAQPGSVILDSLSLFPAKNLRSGWQNPYPFRTDLLDLLKGLKPRQGQSRNSSPGIVCLDEPYLISYVELWP